ncbi:MAG: hypothetical protein ACE5I3_06265 [Phycisphaerae bacterium]
MSEQQPAPKRASPAGQPLVARVSRWTLLWLPGLPLVVAVIAVGSPALDAPWIQGDEHIFIVRNSDVTGASPSEPTGVRWLDIFLHPHEDLYQPVTILSYAVEWSLWGDNRVFHMRLTDVLIHALNGLLLWAVLRKLLQRLCPAGGGTTTVARALACVWALHPMLVGAYAADMGRTHLLAATFTFLSLLCHLRSLRPGGWTWFVAAYLALLLAMLNKPVVGWVIVIFVLEWVLVGLRRMLLSARIYLVGATCVAFALLTLWTTKGTLLVEDSPLPLFGDPLARAALGLGIYLRNFVTPLRWLSAWYPPDIGTGWGHPLVWLGALALAGAGLAAVLAARRARTRGISMGLAWFVAMWLPVSGLVGARVLAAQDRYMYQPMVGLLLVIGVGLLHWTQRGRAGPRRRGLIIAMTAVALGAAAVPWDWHLCGPARSTIQRARHAVELNPGDPRVMEFLATAYSFTRNHPTLEERLPEPPNPTALFERTLAEAGNLAEQNPQHFRDNHDRAAFHRRLSFEWWKLGRDYERLFEQGSRRGAEAKRLLEQARRAGIADDLLPEHARQKYEQSLGQAERAHDFEPQAKLTWVRLAHAYRSLHRWEEARRAFQKLENVMPDDAPDYSLRYTEFADLLLNRFNDPRQALDKYRKAMMSPGITAAARRIAWLGAARCEVLAGKGSDGFELARQVLRVEPNNLEAWRVIALYHLRSHHWDDADGVYRQILARHPSDYELLRGFQNVCAVKGNWRDAAFAWQDAIEHEQDNLIYRSYFVWAAACAAEESAGMWAGELLKASPDNRFACLAHGLLAIRTGAFEDALQWVQRARQGPKLPLAREFVRAEATLRMMIERRELPQEAVLLQAALWAEIGSVSRGQQLVRQYLEGMPEPPWRALAERILTQDLRAETAP